MKVTALVFSFAAILAKTTQAYIPQQSTKAFFAKDVAPTMKTDKGFGVKQMKQAALSSIAALTLATSLMAPVAQAVDFQDNFGSSIVVSQKVTREGVYGEYTVDLEPQQVDDARSTYKAAKETRSKKGEIIVLFYFKTLTGLLSQRNI